jgi:hypothetical protein
MTAAQRPSDLVERCWFCDGVILQDDATRVLPGIGLTVHAHCYAAAFEPPPSPPTSAA